VRKIVANGALVFVDPNDVTRIRDNVSFDLDGDSVVKVGLTHRMVRPLLMAR
jgi:hypothetical protein